MNGPYILKCCNFQDVHHIQIQTRLIVALTEQYDDADEYSDDGTGAQSGGCHGPRGTAVPVIVAGTHFDSDHGAVGQRRVPRVGHDDGDLVHACLQVRNPQPELSIVTWSVRARRCRGWEGWEVGKGSEEEGQTKGKIRLDSVLQRLYILFTRGYHVIMFTGTSK